MANLIKFETDTFKKEGSPWIRTQDLSHPKPVITHSATTPRRPAFPSLPMIDLSLITLLDFDQFLHVYTVRFSEFWLGKGYYVFYNRGRKGSPG